MKKKITSFLLALGLTMSLSVTAFAANSETVTSDSGTATITVKGTYQGSATGGTISVNIAWDEMNFTYTAAGNTWNPKTHSYNEDGNGGWSTDTATITVTNHSEVAVKATLSFTLNESLSGITGTFTENSGTASDNVLELATAVNTAVDSAPSASAEFGISGGAISESMDTLGTITVTISKATE